MFPDLSYLAHYLFGSSPDNWLAIFKTFGLFLVLAIMSAGFITYLELKRKAKQGLFKPTIIEEKIDGKLKITELISNVAMGLLLGLKVPLIYQNFETFKHDPASFVFSSEGNWALGILLAAIFGGYTYWEKTKNKSDKPRINKYEWWPHDRIGDITVRAALFGVLGAKLFSVIEDLPAFFADPIGVFFSGAGLAIYGGLIGGFLGVTWYLRKHDIPVIHVADAIAPSLIIGYGIGRMGCHFSGDGDWGIVAANQPSWWFLPDWLWSMRYPNNVNNDGIVMDGVNFFYNHILPKGVYPTPLYEIFAAFLIGGILWSLRKRLKIPGMLFFLYLVFNGLERFFIEKIRVNIKYEKFGIEYTQAEFIAVILFLIGIAGIVVLYSRNNKNISTVNNQKDIRL